MNSTWYMYFVAIKQWTVKQHTVSHTRHVTYITITQTGFNHIHTDSSDTQGYFPHTHTHTRLMAFFREPRSAYTRKVKPVWILLKQETVSGSGNSWAIRKSAPISRQITMPAPHHSFSTGRMPFLLPNQQHQSTEGLGYFPDSSGIAPVLHLEMSMEGATRTVHYFYCSSTQL